MVSDSATFQDVFDGSSGKQLGYVMLDAAAVGGMRRELMDNLGWEVTRGILERVGYQCGRHDAHQLRKRYSWPSDEEWLRAGLRLHCLEGMVKVQPGAIGDRPSRREAPHHRRVARLLRSRTASAAIWNRQPFRLLDARRDMPAAMPANFSAKMSFAWRPIAAGRETLPADLNSSLRPNGARQPRPMQEMLADGPVYGAVRPLPSHHQRHGLRTRANLAGCHHHDGCQRHHHLLQPGSQRNPGNFSQRSDRQKGQLLLCRGGFRSALDHGAPEGTEALSQLSDGVCDSHGTQDADCAVGFGDSQPDGRNCRHDRSGS